MKEVALQTRPTGWSPTHAVVSCYATWARSEREEKAESKRGRTRGGVDMRSVTARAVEGGTGVEQAREHSRRRMVWWRRVRMAEKGPGVQEGSESPRRRSTTVATCCRRADGARPLAT